MFDVSVAFEKRLDKCHYDVLPPCHMLFTTVPVKLILYGMLLYGLCQVNVLGGEGVTFVSLIVNVITSENYLTSLIPTCARKCGCKTSEGKFC